MIDPKKIRNFSIIAHIDHGKSTLSDRLIELGQNPEAHQSTKTQTERMTDTLEIEQERGITIKLQPATINWKGYTLNLIDTPGHVDFNYEVSRSLKACEGVILLIDATQGIQAQTITNLYLAFDHDLAVIPVLNKVDIPNINLDQRLVEIEHILGFKKDEVILASGKTGQGVEQILDQVIEKVPDPQSQVQDSKSQLKALIFDSFYDEHRGVVAEVRLFSGQINIKDQPQLYIHSNQTKFEPIEIGIFKPELEKQPILSVGQVGYIATGIKDIKKVTVGDTITDDLKTKAIAGYQKPKATVFASIYPTQANDFLELKQAVDRLALNDAALVVKKQRSPLLGQGFRCGFLGILHLEITKERLEKEFDIETIFTVPTVQYQIIKKNGEKILLRNADDYPDPVQIEQILEPWINIEIITPQEHMNSIIELIKDFRGIYKSMENLSGQHLDSISYLSISAELPFAAMLNNFFSVLKGVSHGYASFSYTPLDYRPVDLVKVDILVHKEPVPSFAFLEIRQDAPKRARKILKTLQQAIPRHMFAVSLQAAIGGKIIAREDIRALKKNVTAKLYGGDITRKMKLRKKQAKGKKEMLSKGKVNIPPDAFISVIKGK